MSRKKMDDNIKQNQKNKNLKNTDEVLEKSTSTSLKAKIIIFLLIILVIAIIYYGIYLAIYIHNFNVMTKEMISNHSSSSVLDTDGNNIANLGSGRITSYIESASIPDNLKNAYIAIEDQRFYSHHGVDIKRTSGAIWNYVKGFGKSSFGGSTITQQLVKNLTGDNSKNISRKVKEWALALSLESTMNKDDILVSYLNNIYVGPNLYGIENSAKYYFNKSVSELNLEECAFIAGINTSPNSYSPFSEKDNSEKILKRTKTVLNKMLELNYISNDEYNTSISNLDTGLKFKKGNLSSSGSNIYSYHTDTLLNELINDISSQKHISTSFAENYLYMAGLTIHSTQNTDIQKAIENEVKNKKYIIYSKKDSHATAQTAMVIIDHSTGYVVGSVGGIGTKTESRPFNRATQMTRQTGSSVKPIAVLVPAISEKLVTNSTVFEDVATTFDDGSEEGYSPIDYDDYRGSITLRQAVETSQNIPFVTIMEKVTPKTSIKYLKKMGITTLTKNDNSLALALGGLDKGMSPLEVSAAYATIANNGTYIEPTFYKSVVTSSGKTYMRSKQKSRRVFSESVAYILQELLTQPVKGSRGTATYCSISGIDVAAKTGTTNDNFDRWLCGFTPYYTAATWYGFDLNESIEFGGKNPAGLIWSGTMSKIHKGLSNATFTIPKGVTKVNICSDSGKIANSKCKHTYSEYFLTGTLPDGCLQH